MNQKLNCIMLVDDDGDDNFFHEMVITENDFSNTVVVQDSVMKALDYLKSRKMPLSDLIFLDINMPRMSGWDFLAEYGKLDKESRKSPVIVMLSTSFNKDDIEKSKVSDLVSDYITKPLTKEIVKGIIDKYFQPAH